MFQCKIKSMNIGMSDLNLQFSSFTERVVGGEGVLSVQLNFLIKSPLNEALLNYIAHTVALGRWQPYRCVESASWDN